MKPVDMDASVRRRRLTVLAIGGAFLAGSILFILNEHKLARKEHTKNDNLPLGTKTVPSKAVTKESDLPLMSVDELIRHLMEGSGGNSLGFESRYGNTRYKFTGAFLLVTGPRNDGLYSMLLSGGGGESTNLHSPRSACLLSESQRATLETLRTGDIVDSSGVPMLFEGQVLFYDCRILAIHQTTGDPGNR